MESSFMRGAVLVFALTSVCWSQSSDEPTLRSAEPGPGRQIGSGAGNIGMGAAKGAGDLAKGVAKGAGDLATLHPIDAGVAVSKGAGTAGKDVAVGTVKGTAKIGKGVGRAVRRIF